MNMTKTKAEKLINGILSELEKDSGSVVKLIDLVDVEVTTAEDKERQFIRTVEIDMERLPGTRWSK